MNQDIFREHRVTRAERRVESNEENIKEAFLLLGLINAEFQSDPMSTACFDARIVERVKTCVRKRENFEAGGPPTYIPPPRMKE